MTAGSVRVRFAPSPTGRMHLGGVRTALLNYLFAHQKEGTFVLRIEDTDRERNFDPGAKQIIADLLWLGLLFEEGPGVEGPYAPYFQSERNNVYKEHLAILQDKKLVYKCFCTSEELEKRRERQIALKQPPRYDKTCLKLSKEDVAKKEAAHLPFVWRFAIKPNTSVTITDLAKGVITFDLNHFSDFPLTRQDGTFTFIFANAVDDMVMRMTHILRGEDHLSNTANQAVLYEGLGFKLPLFWHLPILCNTDGKKLSKRDFGFSLEDLQKAGYIPEAITNYLMLIGGGSFQDEIMSMDQLIKLMPFDNINSTGAIKYDVEKLTWVNHKWIERLSPEKLLAYAKPFLLTAYPQAQGLPDTQISALLQIVKSEMKTIADVETATRFYFEAPKVTDTELHELVGSDATKLSHVLAKHLDLLDKPEQFVQSVKAEAQEHKISIKTLFTYLRLKLTGSTKGPQLHDIINLIGVPEAKKRLT
ncbi:MAG: glutamate--tRNA ligase [Candidatus Babeliales bacterium]